MSRALLVLALLLPTWVRAQSVELENPGRVSAIQERKYRMDHELELGVGLLPLDAFYKGLTVQLGYTFHFNDTFGWRVGRGAYSYNINTSLRDQLERDFAVNPTAFPQVRWFLGSDLVWSPLYGKAAFLNEKVLHFSLYGVVGGTVMNLRVADDAANGVASTVFRPGAHLGVGARFFNSEHLSFKLEISNNFVFDSGLLNVPFVNLAAALNFGGAE